MGGPCVESVVVVLPACRSSSIGILDGDSAILAPDSHRPVLWEVSIFENKFEVVALFLAGFHRHPTVLISAVRKSLIPSSCCLISIVRGSSENVIFCSLA